MSIEFRDASPEVVAFFNGVDVKHTNQVILCTVALDVDRIEDADGREFVPVVRCRDCEHYHADIHGCDEFGDEWRGEYASVGPDGFCAWGERREDA